MFQRAFDMRSALCCVAFLAAAGLGSSAYGQVFSNNAPITIPDSGTATPYPSTISIAGVPGVAGSQVGGIKVRLKGITHTFMADVAALLVAPNGRGFQLLDRNGGSSSVSGVTVTLDAASRNGLPAPLGTGTFAASGGATAFASPAQAIPRAGSLADLTNGNVNGAWTLYVQDFAGGDFGSFAGGWEIEFGDFGAAGAPVSASAFTYQGRLDGAPADGTIDARFTLMTDATATAQIYRFAPPVTVSGITMANGVFSTPVDFGVQVPADRRTWLQIDIASPAGGSFSALTPRQPMTSAALATPDYGVLVGSSVVAGGDQHSEANQGGKSRFGYALNLFGDQEFVGMQPIVAPGTAGCGNSGDIGFFTWECDTSTSREIMRINGRGNVGIGTATPAAKLDVRGGIAMGNDGTLRAASGSEDLRLLRGSFSLAGATLVGSGFSVTRPATGTYTITFATPFSGVAAVSANAFESGSALIVTVSTVSATQATVIVRNTSNALTNSAVSFTVMGPR